MKKSLLLRQRLAKPNNAGIWWAPSINPLRNQTGTAHVVHNGGALCGARPFAMGGSFRTAAEGGALECARCRRIVDEACHDHTP